MRESAGIREYVTQGRKREGEKERKKERKERRKEKKEEMKEKRWKKRKEGKGEVGRLDLAGGGRILEVGGQSPQAQG